MSPLFALGIMRSGAMHDKTYHGRTWHSTASGWGAVWWSYWWPGMRFATSVRRKEADRAATPFLASHYNSNWLPQSHPIPISSYCVSLLCHFPPTGEEGRVLSTLISNGKWVLSYMLHMGRLVFYILCTGESLQNLVVG